VGIVTEITNFRSLILVFSSYSVTQHNHNFNMTLKFTRRTAHKRSTEF